MNRDDINPDNQGNTGMTDEDLQREDLGETSQEDSLTDETY